jgi:hypothetical protein
MTLLPVRPLASPGVYFEGAARRFEAIRGERLRAANPQRLP